VGRELGVCIGGRGKVLRIDGPRLGNLFERFGLSLAMRRILSVTVAGEKGFTLGCGVVGHLLVLCLELKSTSCSCEVCEFSGKSLLRLGTGDYI